MNSLHFLQRPLTLALASAVVTVAAMGSTHAASLTETFETTTTVSPVPVGWTGVNRSSPLGPATWAKGATTPFAAQAGTNTSYISANFDSVDNIGTISNWLILPTLSFDNGDVVSFFTRTPTLSQFADRLELRFSAVGGTDVGLTDTSVGTFTQLLLTVNPALTVPGYPEVWTQFSATITGLSGTTNGAVAFRYFVTDGGGIGSNSNFIGIDTVAITPVPEPAAYLMFGLGLGVVALRRLRQPR
jgi:PEP-CTERM motif